MRLNVYAEEMTDRVEIISKTIEGHEFTGLRIYLELPATLWRCRYCKSFKHEISPGTRCTQGGSCVFEPFQASGPFLHREGDDDSSAVTFWGKRDLRTILRKALALLDEHYDEDRCRAKNHDGRRCEKRAGHEGIHYEPGCNFGWTFGWCGVCHPSIGPVSVSCTLAFGHAGRHESHAQPDGPAGLTLVEAWEDP